MLVCVLDSVIRPPHLLEVHSQGSSLVEIYIDLVSFPLSHREHSWCTLEGRVITSLLTDPGTVLASPAAVPQHSMWLDLLISY